MNGLHDCGGMDYHGLIHVESNEPVFHEEWEGRAFGLLLAIGMNGFYNLDEFRHCGESRTPLDYLTDPYYAGWLNNYETLLVRKGVITREELIDARRLTHARLPEGAVPALTKDMVSAVLDSGGSARRDVGTAPRFRAGDRVVTRNINIAGHTRLPRYARGKTGVVVEDRGIFTFNDSMANENAERAQHIYSVRFFSHDLWGDAETDRDTCHLDLWDEYLSLADVGERAA